MFLYTNSNGQIRICDMRESSNFTKRCSAQFNLMQSSRSSGADIFDSQILQASDAKFIPGSEHCVLSRDYLSVKLWDVRAASSNPS